MSLGNSRVPEQSRLNRNFLLIVSIAVMGNAFLSSYAQSALGLLASSGPGIAGGSAASEAGAASASTPGTTASSR